MPNYRKHSRPLISLSQKAFINTYTKKDLITLSEIPFVKVRTSKVSMTTKTPGGPEKGMKEQTEWWLRVRSGF